MFAVSGQTINISQPGKKKKKAPKNAFSFFLDEEYQKRKGTNSQVLKSELAGIIGSQWKNMTKEEKSVYENRARELKMNKSSSPVVLSHNGRLDCTNQLLTNRVDMQSHVDTQRNNHRAYLSARWKNMDVKQKHFIIISFQSLYELPGEEGYLPCELTCVDYTLSGGIQNYYHQIIDPGAYKPVLMSEVKFFRERTHQISRDCGLARSDYYAMWRELVAFIRGASRDGDGQIPPIYSRMSEIKKNVFCLDWLAQNAGMANQLCKVFELEFLVSELISNAMQTKTPLSSIESGFTSSMWEYEIGIKCDYHEEIDCYFCTMLTIKKCCFWISEVLSPIYHFPLTENHLPSEQADCFKQSEFKVDLRDPPKNYDINPFSSGNPIQNGGYRESNVPQHSQFESTDIRYRGIDSSNEIHRTTFNSDYSYEPSICSDTASLTVTDDNFPSLGGTSQKSHSDSGTSISQTGINLSNTQIAVAMGVHGRDPFKVTDDDFPALGMASNEPGYGKPSISKSRRPQTMSAVSESIRESASKY